MYTQKVKKRCGKKKCPCRHNIGDSYPSGGSLKPTIDITNPQDNTFSRKYNPIQRKVSIPYIKSGYSPYRQNEVKYGNTYGTIKHA
jgi:hypothetical protein